MFALRLNFFIELFPNLFRNLKDENFMSKKIQGEKGTQLQTKIDHFVRRTIYWFFSTFFEGI